MSKEAMRAPNRKQTEQLAYVMQFLYSLGFDLDTVKRAADGWWQIKDGAGETK